MLQTKKRASCVRTQYSEKSKKMEKKLDVQEFAKRLTELRLKKNVTATKVVEYIELNAGRCSKTAYSDYEYGKRFPSVEALDSISKYFNVSVDYLLYGKVDEVDTSVRKIIKCCGEKEAKTVHTFMSQILAGLEQTFDIE